VRGRGVLAHLAVRQVCHNGAPDALQHYQDRTFITSDT
jgi:hypothetical protein